MPNGRKPRYPESDQSTRPVVKLARAPPCALPAVRAGDRSANGIAGASENGD
jgi:hypothetical protein